MPGPVEPLYSCFQILCCRQGLTVACEVQLEKELQWTGRRSQPCPAGTLPQRQPLGPWIPLLGKANLLSGSALGLGSLQVRRPGWVGQRL